MACPSLIPGFRFHPTDVELAMFYLKRKLLGKKIAYDVVSEVNIYDFGPWDLPDKSALKSGDLEWYFFCPKSKKYSSGGRSNRTTETGFWKATGKDRTIKYNGRTVATIKTLVFHIGHKGTGDRTDWVMHEYKMEDEHLANSGIVQDMYVLCKVFQKSGSGPKNGAQYGAPFKEEEWGDESQLVACPVGASNTMDIEQEGLATMNSTEHVSSVVYDSANAPGLATMNATEHGSSGGVVTEPGSPSGPLPVTPSIKDCLSFEDFGDTINISKDNEAADNNNIYKELVNLIDLDDLNKIEFMTDGDDYKLDQLLALGELD